MARREFYDQDTRQFSPAPPKCTEVLYEVPESGTFYPYWFAPESWTYKAGIRAEICVDTQQPFRRLNGPNDPKEGFPLTNFPPVGAYDIRHDGTWSEGLAEALEHFLTTHSDWTISPELQMLYEQQPIFQQLIKEQKERKVEEVFA